MIVLSSSSSTHTRATYMHSDIIIYGHGKPKLHIINNVGNIEMHSRVGKPPVFYYMQIQYQHTYPGIFSNVLKTCLNFF